MEQDVYVSGVQPCVQGGAVSLRRAGCLMAAQAASRNPAWWLGSVSEPRADALCWLGV